MPNRTLKLLFSIVLLLAGLQLSARKFTFKVIDGNTLSPIANPDVTVSWGKSFRKCTADMIGNPVCDLDTGKYKVSVHADGYRDLDTVISIKPGKDFCVLMMYKQTFEDRNVSFSVKEGQGVISLNIEDLRKPVEEPELDEPDTVKAEEVVVHEAEPNPYPETLNKDTVLTVGPTKIETKTAISKDAPTIPAPVVKKQQVYENTVMQPKREESFFFEDDSAYADTSAPVLPDEILTEAEYLPNNIIILIDRSSSMQLEGRYTLLKRSVLKLVDHLRPIDKLSLIAYGNSIDVLAQGVEGNDRKSVESGLRKVKPAGGSEYSKGLKMAYEIAREEMIADGNNIIILATDGELVITSAVRAMISERQRAGVKLSIFGIKNGDATERNMRELVLLGGGDYLNMKKARKVDQLLVEEIKSQSIIKK